MSNLPIPYEEEPAVMPVLMTLAEARACVQEIKQYVSTARGLLLELYERKGYQALGYATWRDCVTSEFGQGQAQLYRQLQAAKIQRNITRVSHNEKQVETTEIPETHLRPLARLAPEEQAEAWQRAHDTAPNGKITAAHVAQTVTEMKAAAAAAAEPENSSDPEEDSLFRLIPPHPRREPPYLTLADWDELHPDLLLQGGPIWECPNANKQFNKQTTTSIEWARWSWNPVTGCKHDCPYCYARDIANRFYEQGFEPVIYPERMTAPDHTPVPREAAADISYKNVFTCSMADLFGRWVPARWIEAVLWSVERNPQWNFLFLTKFPKRYCEFEFPENAWLGTTVDCQARVKNAEDAFAKVTGGTRWLSVEPLLEPLRFTRLDLFHWVVIGGASESSQTPAWVPPIDWIADLHQQARAAGCRIYYKDNCGMADALRIREFPWGTQLEKRLPDSFRYLGGMQDDA